MLAQSDHESVRQRAEDDGTVARMGEVAGRGSEWEARQGVGLPVRVHLHPRDRVVRGQ